MKRRSSLKTVAAGAGGFSAHATRAALNAMSKYRFDTVMFPINFVELFRFSSQVNSPLAPNGITCSGATVRTKDAPA